MSRALGVMLAVSLAELFTDVVARARAAQGDPGVGDRQAGADVALRERGGATARGAGYRPVSSMRS